MIKRTILTASIALALLATYSTDAADKGEKSVEKAELKCPVSGRPAKEDKSLAYKGAKVYFCCDNCPKAFAANTAKYAPKANLQLYATGQAKLVKCPIAGRKLNPATKIEVAGVDVCFCCNNCKGKALKAEGDEQIVLIFGEKAFEKGFEVKKAKKDE